ncbi:hypothetical protein KQX54_013719 [Cotesia glomerata]|uniref:Uncharacterized protein n=1 Tax=Cotesia glomerata TaxID=32391 RepID=A0AAV7ILN8_COTGL|nr:hypothetical protein KQX54_013719 [Cotesia glomerata]
MKRGKEERDKIVNPHSKVDEICPGRQNGIIGKRVGLDSILTILCDKCSINMLVPTGKMRSLNYKKNKSDVNTKAVLGTVHAGMGCTALNKLLACLNIPTISSTLFKRYEREIGPVLEERARESCKQAAEEERQLVIDNIINLIAHNAAFDTGHLIRAIIQNSMVETFKNVVGFTDTLSILKKIYLKRRGPGLFKLSKLAEDLLQQNGDFHEALYDVQVLQQLSSKFIGSKKLINSRKSYVECLANEAKSQKADTLMPSLKILKGIVSDNMLKKIANAGIDFNMMLAASEDKENQRLVQLLSELNDFNKPRVTKDKKILKKINDFLENYQECNIKISIN